MFTVESYLKINISLVTLLHLSTPYTIQKVDVTIHLVNLLELKLTGIA